MKRKRIVGNAVKNGLLALYAIFALFPLFWMVLISFKSDAQMFNTTFIFDPTLENYDAVLLRTDYFKYFLDSIIVSVVAVLISVLAGVPAAYALARYNFKKKESLAFTILSFRFAPEILVVLPLFMIYQKIGLYDTYFGLIWVYQLQPCCCSYGFRSSLRIFQLRSSMRRGGRLFLGVFLKRLLP